MLLLYCYNLDTGHLWLLLAISDDVWCATLIVSILLLCHGYVEVETATFLDIGELNGLSGRQFSCTLSDLVLIRLI